MLYVVQVNEELAHQTGVLHSRVVSLPDVLESMLAQWFIVTVPLMHSLSPRRLSRIPKIITTYLLDY